VISHWQTPLIFHFFFSQCQNDTIICETHENKKVQKIQKIENRAMGPLSTSKITLKISVCMHSLFYLCLSFKENKEQAATLAPEHNIVIQHCVSVDHSDIL
jgi:hypothetical protein